MTKATKKSVYEIVTDSIMEKLESGVTPWRKTWSGGSGGYPKNAISKKAYRGINIIMLGLLSPYDSPHWLTFKQAKALGGSVRKGEKSSIAVFWKWYDKKDADGESKIPVLRYYRVFNIEQCDIPADKMPAESPVKTFEHDAIAECENVLANIADMPQVEHQGGRACYSPSTDEIKMPAVNRFESREAYYATLFHELTHSTGAASRLNRAGVAGDIHFGSDPYAKEELIAEMGAAFMCGHCGIETATIDNQAAYIAGWMKAIKSDPKMVVNAAAAAQKAVDYMLGTSWEDADSDATANAGELVAA